MKIVYFGKWARGVACLDALLSSRHHIAAIVAQHETEEPSLRPFAERNGLNVLMPEDVNASDFLDTLRSFRAESFVLAGYTKLLKKEAISIPSAGCINLHGGRLPDYRGASPLNWQIINGESEIGLSIFYLDEGIDTGDIIAEARFALTDNDTVTEVLEKSLDIFPKMLVDTLDTIDNGTVRRIKQNLSAGRTYPKRRPEDGKILWDKMTARNIYNLVRALTPPYPGAFAFYNGQKVVIRKASCFPLEKKGPPGRITGRIGTGVVLATLDGGIVFEKVLPLNTDRVVSANEFFTEMNGSLT